MPTTPSTKTTWQGTLLAIQPRIRLLRSFDQTHHSYHGYNLRLRGTLTPPDTGAPDPSTTTSESEFTVAAGPKAHEKHHFQIGQHLSGLGEPVQDPRLEIAQLYKLSKLKVEQPDPGNPPPQQEPPPFHHLAPDLDTYRQRGHRRLAARTYSTHCNTCVWACEMPVEMIIDQWNPSNVRYRRETFCYGPKSCRLYKAGPTRKVPGRKGMTYEEPDWVDEEATAHRGPDE